SCLERLARAGLCLPGRLRDVADGDVDLLNRRRLLFGTEFDLSSRLGGSTHEAYDLPEGCCHFRELTRARVNRLAAALCGHHCAIYGGADLINEPTDLLGGTTHTIGELSNFVRDHGKTLARLPCTGGFDSRVDGEDVRLFGKLVGDFENAADLLRLLPEVEHVGHDEVDLPFDASDRVVGLRNRL